MVAVIISECPDRVNLPMGSDHSNKKEINKLAIVFGPEKALKARFRGQKGRSGSQSRYFCGGGATFRPAVSYLFMDLAFSRISGPRAFGG
jgi:hypothetical protein